MLDNKIRTDMALRILDVRGSKPGPVAMLFVLLIPLLCPGKFWDNGYT